MPATKDELLAHLARLGIEHRLHEHEACFTVEQARRVCTDIPGVHCKNLFLKDKADRLFLLTVPDERVVDLKTLDKRIGSKRLSFGKPELQMEVLGVPPGSVTPLALINDTARRVTVFLDAWMMQQELINVHPLVNTATVTLTPKGLGTFLQEQGYAPELLESG